MNIENMQKLKAWLDDGAPEAVLALSIGFCRLTDEEVEFQSGYRDVNELLVSTGQTGKGACGTVCCIAGAASLMSQAPEGQMFPDAGQPVQSAWFKIRNSALKHLGLDNEKEFYGHNLFDHNLAPANCTPEQASRAVQNVIDGKEPWVET